MQRLETDSDIGDMLPALFRTQTHAFKINMSFDFILGNVETGETRYYYPSQNGFIFDQPLVVADEADLQSVLQHVGETDWVEYVRLQKPNSKWRFNFAHQRGLSPVPSGTQTYRLTVLLNNCIYMC